MASQKQFFRFSLDESGLHDFFNSIEDRLNSHEERITKQDEIIRELQRLLREKPSFDDLDRMRDEIRMETNEKFTLVNIRLDKLENQMKDLQRVTDNLANRMDKLEESLDARFKEMQDKLDQQQKDLWKDINDKLDKIAALLPKDNGDHIGEIFARLKSVEDGNNATAKKLQATRDAVQTIASAFASLNNTTAALDGSLNRVLHASANHVKDNFSTIFDLLNKLQSDVEKLQALIEAPKPVRPPESDISGLYLRPPFTADWRDPPVLPKLQKFNRVSQAVDYIYDLVPRLQGYLNAMHDRMLDEEELFNRCADRFETDQALDDLQKQINELGGDLTELRRNLGKFASKADLANALKKLGYIDPDSNTAAGRIRCIACGREVPQITGAMSERDAIRQLGSAPNCVVTPSGHGVSQMFSNTEKIDSNGLIESPRSLRPFRASCSVRKKPRGAR